MMAKNIKNTKCSLRGLLPIFNTAVSVPMYVRGMASIGVHWLCSNLLFLYMLISI